MSAMLSAALPNHHTVALNPTIVGMFARILVDVYHLPAITRPTTARRPMVPMVTALVGTFKAAVVALFVVSVVLPVIVSVVAPMIAAGFAVRRITWPREFMAISVTVRVVTM
tara:strand:- start:149 stop:484 length:336 start_codon:yes stop_codon:yes gene_type:complete